MKLLPQRVCFVANILLQSKELAADHHPGSALKRTAGYQPTLQGHFSRVQVEH